MESLSKQDNLNTYCGSPKLDYCSQYELKMEGSGEDTDPDIIPCHYGKIKLIYLLASVISGKHSFGIKHILCYNSGSTPMP